MGVESHITVYGNEVDIKIFGYKSVQLLKHFLFRLRICVDFMISLMPSVTDSLYRRFGGSCRHRVRPMQRVDDSTYGQYEESPTQRMAFMGSRNQKC